MGQILLPNGFLESVLPSLTAYFADEADFADATDFIDEADVADEADVVDVGSVVDMADIVDVVIDNTDVKDVDIIFSLLKRWHRFTAIKFLHVESKRESENVFLHKELIQNNTLKLIGYLAFLRRGVGELPGTKVSLLAPLLGDGV